MRTTLFDNLAFIGCGALGSSLIRGILSAKLYPLKNLYLYDRDVARTQQFPGAHGCASAQEAIDQADIVFLAVKPQDIWAALDGVSVAGRIVVSLVAGVTSDALRRGISGCVKALRVMPNIALGLRSAVTAYATPTGLSRDELDRILTVFRACGKVEALPEDSMDVATAVSGSGPAYYAYFMDAMVRAATAQGMERDEAVQLVIDTAESAIALMRQPSVHPDVLLQEVSSRGGTTEAALGVLEAAGVEQVIERAITVAADRSRELGRAWDRQEQRR